MITQKNITVSAIGQAHGYGDARPGDRHISYLPLSHIFQQFVEILCMMLGVGIGYFGGDMLGLLDDIQTLKPTVRGVNGLKGNG